MDVCIPNDIVDDILLRLPANCLIRLRWACKYWFDLITRDPSFIKMQYHSSTHNEIINNNPCVLLKNYKGDLFKRFLNYTTYNASPKVKLDLPFKCNSFEILSSCNGLILFRSCSTLGKRELCIWNPCTKEYKVLPEPLKFDCDRVTYGFGYDHTIDDYKVIRNAYNYKLIRNAYHYRDNYETTAIQVYNLRTDTWRSINERMPNSISGYYSSQDVGVFVNGALYWIIRKRLFSFDIVKEKYHEILTTYTDLFNRKLGAFEGCLCLLPTPSIYGGEMYVMNMKNYSWRKVCTVTGVMTKALRFTENDNILMVGSSPWRSPSDLILLNTKKGKSTNLNICHRSDVQEVYIESLVSLASDRTSKENEGDDVSTKRTSKENEEDDVSTKRRKVNTDVCIF